MSGPGIGRDCGEGSRCCAARPARASGVGDRGGPGRVRVRPARCGTAPTCSRSFSWLGVVGLIRIALRGRLQHFFVLLNITLLAQPAAHAASTLTRAAADRLPHSHVVPDGVWALGLQLAITLLVVIVAGSEPILAFVGSRRIVDARTRLLVGTAPLEDESHQDRHTPRPPVGVPVEVLLARSRPPRGPPVPAQVIPA